MSIIQQKIHTFCSKNKKKVCPKKKKSQKRNERDTLDNYLRQALDDRQIFEKRSYEVDI